MSDQLPPAGWYPDPQLAGTQRYWDGASWTSYRNPPLPDRRQTDNVITAGYVFAVLFPLIGFIIGLTQINRDARWSRVVMLSILAAIVWAVLWAALTGDDGRNFTELYKD
jgi:hypothetical protein